MNPSYYRVQEALKSRKAAEESVRIATNDSMSLQKRLSQLQLLRTIVDAQYDTPDALELVLRSEGMLHSIIEKQAHPALHWTTPLTIQKSWQEDGRAWYIEGIASTPNIDRDGDKMSQRALKEMTEAMNGGLNLFLDHKHEVTNTLGVITKAELRSDGIHFEARLEDPAENPTVKNILHKISLGEHIGISIGGDMAEHYYEDGGYGSKRVRVIDSVKLYEVSIVGLPSNSEAVVLGSVYKQCSNCRPISVIRPLGR